MLEIPAPCKVFGDVHGQFMDLLKFFDTYGSPDARTGDINYINYVFVGDWVYRTVDRAGLDAPSFHSQVTSTDRPVL